MKRAHRVAANRSGISRWATGLFGAESGASGPQVAVVTGVIGLFVTPIEVIGLFVTPIEVIGRHAAVTRPSVRLVAEQPMGKVNAVR